MPDEGKKIKVYHLGGTNPIREGVINHFDMDDQANWCIFFQGDRTFSDALQIDRNLEYEVVEETRRDQLLSKLESTVRDLRKQG